MDAASTGPILAAVRNRYMKAFMRQNALSPQTAIVPEDFGLKRGIMFKRLQRQGILCEAGNNAYYLNKPREQALNKKRRKAVIIVMASLVIIAFIMFWVINK